jgi:hypothetical protein
LGPSRRGGPHDAGRQAEIDAAPDVSAWRFHPFKCGREPGSLNSPQTSWC